MDALCDSVYGSRLSHGYEMDSSYRVRGWWME